MKSQISKEKNNYTYNSASKLDLDEILEEFPSSCKDSTSKLAIKSDSSATESSEIAKLFKLYQDLSDKYNALESEVKDLKFSIYKSGSDSKRPQNKHLLYSRTKAKDLDQFINSIHKKAQQSRLTSQIDGEEGFMVGINKKKVQVDEEKKTPLLEEFEDIDFDSMFEEEEKKMEAVSIKIGSGCKDGKFECKIEIGDKSIRVQNIDKGTLCFAKEKGFSCKRIEIE